MCKRSRRLKSTPFSIKSNIGYTPDLLPLFLNQAPFIGYAENHPLIGAIDFNDLTEAFKTRIFAQKNSSIMKISQ